MARTEAEQEKVDIAASLTELSKGVGFVGKEIRMREIDGAGATMRFVETVVDTTSAVRTVELSRDSALVSPPRASRDRSEGVE